MREAGVLGVGDRDILSSRLARTFDERPAVFAAETMRRYGERLRLVEVG